MAKTKIATLEEILATRVKQQWMYRVDINANTHELKEMSDWCQTKTTGKWRYNERIVDYFQFENDSDAMMFMLKFGGRKRQ